MFWNAFQKNPYGRTWSQNREKGLKILNQWKFPRLHLAIFMDGTPEIYIQICGET